jgi:hypothetical protein
MPSPSDAPERHPYGYPWRKRFPDAHVVVRFEGGAVYAAVDSDGFWLIRDEGTLADLLDPVEDADVLARLVSVQHLDDKADWLSAIDAERDRFDPERRQFAPRGK